MMIPNLIDLAKAINTDALFVLVVEKDATFQRLLDDQFLQNYPAILITVHRQEKNIIITFLIV